MGIKKASISLQPEAMQHRIILCRTGYRRPESVPLTDDHQTDFYLTPRHRTWDARLTALYRNEPGAVRWFERNLRSSYGEQMTVLRGFGALVAEGAASLPIEVHPAEFSEPGKQANDTNAYFSAPRYRMCSWSALPEAHSIWADEIAAQYQKRAFFIPATPLRKPRP